MRKADDMTYAFHPAANLFPLMDESSSAFIELVQDIKTNGLLEPIELLDQQILDGRNRYRACQHAGVEARTVQWSGDSPYQHVLSRNLHRRHLTDDQRAMIITAVLPELEREALVHKSTHQPTAYPRSRVSTRQERTSTAVAAKLVGVSRSKVERAKAIVVADPEVAAEVKAGTATIIQAEKKARKPRDNGIDPLLLLPGQVIGRPPTKIAPTLGGRLTEGVSKGLGLPKLAIEIRSYDPDLDDKSILSLIERLKAQRSERLALIKALEALLARRNSI